MIHFGRDLRQTCLQLARRPGQTALAAATLGLGIGLVTALFSVIDGTVLRGLPFDDAERLVRLERRGLPQGGVWMEEIEAWRDAQHSLEAFTVWLATSGAFSGDDSPADYLEGAYVDPAFFAIVGVEPVLGRVFSPEEAAGSAISPVILGYDVWQARYGSDSGILGRRIDIAGAPAVAIGVMPRGFAFPLGQEYWLPLTPDILGRWSGAQRPPLEAFGRLRDNVTGVAAAIELDAFADRAAATAGGESADTRVESFVAAYTRPAQGPLALMLGAAGSVLLLACLNVVILGLARGVERAPELAVRSALGASRSRMIARLVAESLALGLLAGVAGLGIAAGTTRLFRVSDGLPAFFWVDIRLDGRSLAVLLVLTAVAAGLSALLPALWATGMDPVKALQHRVAARTSGQWSRGLVVTQVSLSAALLVCTLLMVESVSRLEARDIGDDPQRVWTTLVVASSPAYVSSDDRRTFFDELQRRVEELPQVRTAALTFHLPTGQTPEILFEVEGRSVPPGREGELSTRWSVAGSGFFELLGRAPLEGRTFTAADAADTEKVVVVNAAFAAKYLSGKPAVGQAIRLVGGNGPGAKRRIVGVVPDLLLSRDFFAEWIDSGRPPVVYLPHAQSPKVAMSLVARTEGPAGALTPEVRRVLAELDPSLPLLNPRSLAEAMDEASSRYRMIRDALTVFGLVAVLLSAVGLYAVASFAVERRRFELGVRATIGARPVALTASVFRTGLGDVALSLVLGLALGTLSTRALRSALFGVEPLNLVTFATAAAVLLISTLVACVVPAVRAAQTDPAAVLRRE